MVRPREEGDDYFTLHQRRQLPKTELDAIFGEDNLTHQDTRPDGARIVVVVVADDHQRFMISTFWKAIPALTSPCTDDAADLAICCAFWFWCFQKKGVGSLRAANGGEMVHRGRTQHLQQHSGRTQSKEKHAYVGTLQNIIGTGVVERGKKRNSVTFRESRKSTSLAATSKRTSRRHTIGFRRKLLGNSAPEIRTGRK